MAGHMLVSYFRHKTDYAVAYTTRNPGNKAKDHYALDVRDLRKVREAVEAVKPDVIVNAAGLLVDESSRRPADAYLVNAWFPQLLAGLLSSCKWIQISTDCVFAGDRGMYAEQDPPDGTSVYAKTKRQGEVAFGRHLTIRTSLIGPETRSNGNGLWQWFMRQSHEASGYTRVMWNGVTTLEFAKAVHRMIEQDASGVYHLVSPERVSKYELLCLIRDIFDKPIRIVPDDAVVLDRTLRSTRTDVCYSVPRYRQMLTELRDWMRSA